jgi:lipopolysaccharide/colanic/teichoic acid biosynthesis glycosyltransferase
MKIKKKVTFSFGMENTSGKGPHTRTVLPPVLTEQAKLCQVCSVRPARGFTTHAQLNLKNTDRKLHSPKNFNCTNVRNFKHTLDLTAQLLTVQLKLKEKLYVCGAPKNGSRLGS